MRLTTREIRARKGPADPIAMLTAYDYPFARLLDETGVEILLVGDSLGMVVLGYDTTVPVTLGEVLHHTKAVSRAARRALVVADMPFLTYQVSVDEALRNAGRLIQEGGAHAVKLEGGRAVAPTVQRLVECGIPVMGHVGLTPQSIHQIGGFRVQGRTPEEAERILEDARSLETAGVFSIVLECIPPSLAGKITQAIAVPTIGIGAGPDCDGQVQVVHDILGLSVGACPRHARRYAEVGESIRAAVAGYVEDVKKNRFHSHEEAPRFACGAGET